MTNRFRVALALAGFLVCSPVGAAQELSHAHFTLALPGPPVALIPVDLDSDGWMDLVVPLVYTEYEEIEFEEAKGFVQITEIVPALFERRELRAWLGRPDGSYLPAGPPQPLDPSVIWLGRGPEGTPLIWLGRGPEGTPLIALTDSGLQRVSLGSSRDDTTLLFDPIIEDPPVMQGARTYLPGLTLRHELDGDGISDILLPARSGPAVYRSGREVIEAEAVQRLVMPGDRSGGSRQESLWRIYPLPESMDVDDDGLPDLVLSGSGRSSSHITIFRGLGGGRFEEPVTLDTGCLRTGKKEKRVNELAFFGDLDGDGPAEIVTKQETGESDGLDEARKPHMVYRLYHLNRDLTPETEPYDQFEVIGHAVGGDWPRSDRDEMRDLDGDGRKDLVMVTLDFSMWQVLRVLTTKKFGMGLDFHVWMQQPDGGFRETSRKDLKDKLLLDINNLRFDRLDHFSGDFNGDGRFDFVNLKRGDKLSIHFMKPAGEYQDNPDKILKLEAPPQDMRLLWFRDFDADGITDVGVTRPLPSPEDGATAPVILDLYVSMGRP